MISGGDARATVGLRRPDGTVSEAAVIHLVKYGTGRYAPWEIVGTDDTTLTLDTLAYGSAVSSPVTIGGTVTGVDENLRAKARTLGPHALGAGAFPGYCRCPRTVTARARPAVSPWKALADGAARRFTASATWRSLRP